jgi:membrane fusion protein (multidrug efflux system)
MPLPGVGLQRRRPTILPECQMPSAAPRAFVLVFALAALVLAGCGRGGGEQAQASLFGSGPVPVSAVRLDAQTVPLTFEYAGQTIGSREVQVRARVTGILEKRNFREGTRVRAGQSLFTIDPEPFRAAAARAEADVMAAEARLAQARREAARLKPLIEGRAVSRKEYDDAVSAEAIAAADLAVARARLTEARLNLGYTRVEAPISGITSRAVVSEGSLVAGPDVLLTTVTQVDPMHVIFGIPDNEQLRLTEATRAGKVEWPAGNRFRVTVLLADGSAYAQPGVVDFADVRVSRETGTSEARAELPNAEGLLRPGQFVRVRLEGARRRDAFRVPQRAVLEGPQGKFVYVVGKDSKAQMRKVDTAEWVGGDWLVTAGLQAGDEVIVDGTLKLGPGVPVAAGAPGAAGAPPAAAAEAKPADAAATPAGAAAR